MTYRIVLAGLIWIATALMLVPQSHAQSVGSLFSQVADVADDSSTAELTEALRAAAESGVSVVVIDTQGRVVSQPVVEDEPAAEVLMDASSLMKAQESADRFRDALLERLGQLPNAINEVLYILRAASPDGTIMIFAKMLVYSLLLFAVGVLVEREIFGKRIATRFVVSRVLENPVGYAEKMPFLVFRFFMGLIGILVSMAVAYVLGAVFLPPLQDSAAQFTVTLINIGYFCCRVTAGLWRMILSPFLSQYRIPHFNDRDAKRLHNWLWIMASFDICAILFGIWIGELGLNYDVYALFAALLSAAVVLLNILLVLVNRRAVTNALLRGEAPAQVGLLARILARIWAPAVIIYALFAWAELTIDLVLENPSSIPLIAGAYGILISIIVVFGVVNYLIERGFARARAVRALRDKQAEYEAAELERLEAEAQARRELQEDGPDPDADADSALEADTPAGPLSARIEPALAVEAAQIAQAERDALEEAVEAQPVRVLNSFEALARRVAAILAFVAGAYAFFYIWDNDSARMVETVLDRVLDLIIIVFIGYVVYHVFRIWIDTKIAEEVGDEIEAEPGDEGTASSASRLATLLPLFRNFTLIVVVVTIALIVLMEIGINVGPLFAGAGIVGVAVGFGSQALVRDIFAGSKARSRKSRFGRSSCAIIWARCIRSLLVNCR